MKKICVGLLILCSFTAGCHQDPQEVKEKISSIEFDVESVEVNVNEDVIVRVTAKSDEAKKNESIKYTSVNEGFVEIREASNDGFIVKGLKAGSTIIRAQSQNVDKLLEVKVYGEDVLARYIKLSKPVIEVEEGMLVQTSVSLYGRVTEPDDNSLFQWQLETGKNNIAVNAAANIAVIKGLERGYQEINISHPRASFGNKILVFVKGVDEVIQYIYRDSNVLVIDNDGQYHDFDVVLINGEPSDAVDFTYEVVDGKENIQEISGAQTKCNVLAQKGGLSTIRVSHPKAAVDFDVRVVINEPDMPYITLDNSFLLFNVLESERVTAEVKYARNGIAHKSQFSFKILENNAEVQKENSIIEVIQTNESFYIRAKNAGTARVVISNEQAETPREVLVVVREEAVYRDDYYISINQNVITTQVGAEMTRLNARLVNGISADANNMIWDVDDSTVIKLITNHGTVRSRAAVQQVFEAFANIEPLKAGTAKITITNTKWPDTLAQVIVRVYPKGTFAEPPLRIGGDGLIKLEYPQQETIQLRVTEGDESKIKNNLLWEVTPSGIAAFPMPGLQGLTNIMQAAVGAGSLEPAGALGKLTVTGGGIEAPHEAIVMAGNEAYLNSISVIYVDNVYQKVVEQQTIDVHVLNSKTNAQGKPDESWQPTLFTAAVEKPNIAYAVMVQNVLKIMGKERGETDIVVRHSGAVNESITIHLRVEPAYISIDQPYYITGPEIKGVVRQVNTELSVDMPGAPETEKQKLVWASRETAIVTASGAGASVMLYGNTLGQTFVTVGHKNNKAPEKQILVYVAASAADLDNVILGARQQNYLLKTGQEQLVTLITNASEKQKRNIEWNVVTKPGDPAPITINPHYDSAMIRADREGIATVEVTYTDYDENNVLTGKVTTPLSIYVSVVDSFSEEKIIKAPAVVEITRGESRIINVEYLNLSQTELMNIKWAVETAANEEPLANIEGNGDSAYIYGLRRGVGKVKIWQEDIRYTHYATLVCANPGETLYVMGVDSSYQKMMMGEEKKVKLSFGSNGFPETAKRNLRWTADSSGKVKITGSPGDSVSIIAQEPGEATVTVTDGNNPKVSFNETLEMKFLVIDPAQSNLEFRGHQKMVGVVVGPGNKKQVHIRLYDNEEEVKNYHLWSHEVEKENVIRVNRADADPAGQILDIEATAVGESYITVRYKEASARILVYTALNEDDLAHYYPILVEKKNYLLQVGESAVVKIETMAEKDTANFSKVSWGIEGANFIENVDTAGKKEFAIKGKSPGQCIISVNYTDKGTTQTKTHIFVTVVNNEDIDYTKYIVTENVIGMKAGTQVTTRIFHNLGSEVSGVVWDSLDKTKVTVSGSGENATLSAVGTGEAYVTVSYGSWLKRHIRVYVRPASEDIKNYKAMNIENQYYRIGIGETIALPVYFAPVKSTVATIWSDVYRNEVVQLESKENGSKIDVTSINEGVAVLEARNTGLNDQSHVLRIYVEASKRYNGTPKPSIGRYLTMSKTIYVMNPDNRDEELNLVVTPVGYSEEEKRNVTWALADDNGKSGSLISIYPNGTECRVRVNPVGREGTAEIIASKTDNQLPIKIVVSRTGLVGFPHIVGEDTVVVGLTQKTNVIYDVAETGSYDLNQFVVQVMGSGSSYVNAKFTKNVLEIEGIASGQAVLRITCAPTVNEAHYKDVAVLVTTNTDGLVYLTTRDNFTQVKIGETKTISVDMVGIANPSESKYEWEIAEEEDKQYLKLSYTGRQAQVEGLEKGAGQTVKIKVKNTLVDDLFALTMYVRISDNFFNTMYLTTAQNVVTVYEGRSTYLTAELVNGLPGEESMISWSTLNKDVADVMGTGPQAFVIGSHLGMTTIQARYDLTVNKIIEFIVIVEKDNTSDGIYITSSDGLVQMKPGDTRQISVRLVGGVIGDEAGFSWEVFTANPAVKNTKVVNIDTAAMGTDKIIIRAVSEGDATIRVSHRKTSYTIDLKIYVQEYNKVEFDAEQITMNAGEEKIVRVTMPPNTTVRYVVDKPNIIRLSDVGPTSSGFLVITALNVTTMTTVKITAASVEKPLTDEMLVTVNPVVNKSVQYIQTNDTIFNMLDWQNPSNRAMVSGITVGEKAGGGVFVEADSSALEWNITSGSQFIEFDLASDAQKTKTTGKTASIAAKKTGTAEITATHPEMPGYGKKIYVNVMPYDTNFKMLPTFKSMQIRDQNDFTVSITGKIDSSEYRNVTWRIMSNEKEEYGIRFSEKAAGDTDYERTGKAGMDRVKILAEKDGVYKLKAIYEGREVESIVYIEKDKALEIFDETFFKIIPDTTMFIGLYHEPLIKGAENGPKDTWITIKENKNHFMAEIGYCGPIRDENGRLHSEWLPVEGVYYGEYNQERRYNIRSEFNTAVQNRLNNFIDPEGLGRKFNAVLVLRGTQVEGYNTIKITHNNIERVISVHNSNDYSFRMVGIVDQNTREIKQVTEIREQPSRSNSYNDEIVIKYEIMPQGAGIKGVENNGYTLMGNNPFTGEGSEKLVEVKSIDFANQEIRIQLLKCGYTKLFFKNDFYAEKFAKPLEIPVYIYYEKMDLNWVSATGNDALRKSRLDGLSNAIYFANTGYPFYIKIERENWNGLPIFGYRGDDLEVESISFTGSNNFDNVSDFAKKIKKDEYDAYFGNGELGIDNSIAIGKEDDEYLRIGFTERWGDLDDYYRSMYGLVFLVNDVKSANFDLNNCWSAIIEKIEYMGVLEVKYKYSNGGLNKRETSKKFLLYFEQWTTRNY